MASVLITAAGFDKLRAHLEALRSARGSLLERMRKDVAVAGALAAAAEPNGRWELARLEEQIATLEAWLDSASVVAPDPEDGLVGLGESVRVRELGSGEVVEYRVVGAGEADPGAGTISYLSPVGSAVLGRRVGDVVDVEVPTGVRCFQIVEIGS